MKLRTASAPAPSQSACDAIQTAANDLDCDGALVDWYFTYVRSHTQRIALDLDLVERVSSSDSYILDIGATPPILVKALIERGYTAEGVDIKPQRFSSKSGSKPNIFCSDIERDTLPFHDNSVDVISFNEVFEHLRLDLIHSLSETLRILKPKGYFLLSTPNMAGYRGMGSLIVRRRSAFLCPDIFNEYQKLRSLGHMGHVREYTSQDVTTFLSKIGFDIDTVLFRPAPKTSVKKWAAMIWPSFLPFFTIIARKF